MNWQDCFKMYKYKSLLQEECNKNEKVFVEMLLEEEVKPKELQQVYLSEKEDELFIILQLDSDVDSKNLSAVWDSKILSFINFGETFGAEHKWIEKIKYNVTQIFLYTNKAENKVLEKSIDVSRKIFLKCNQNGEVEENEKVRLPFLYDGFDTVTINTKQNDDLKKMLPDKKALAFLYEEHEKIDRRKEKERKFNFGDDELELVKGWLMLE